MTDPDTPAPPGGGPEVAGTSALDLFDAHGAAVFASLCRVTVGDRRIALDVLLATFRQTLGRPRGPHPMNAGDRSLILLLALRTYLADPRADDDWVDPASTGATAASWDSQRGRAVEALRALSARERVALDLALVEGLPTHEISGAIDVATVDVDRIVVMAADELRRAALVDDVAGVVRSAELWFGDDERTSIRRALGAPADHPPDAPPTSDRVRRNPAHTTRTVLVGCVVVAALTAIGVAWVQSLPESDDAQPVETIFSPSPGNTFLDDSDGPVASDPAPSSSADVLTASASQRNGDITVIEVTPVEGSVGEPDLFVMASGLTDAEVVVPDDIVRYADGKIGLSWRSPCDRPAVGVALTATSTGAVVELTTGEFPVRTCLGMPDRWTAVVRPTLPLPEGTIQPLGPTGSLVPDWDGTIDAGGPAGAAEALGTDSFYGAALVDAANQPWVYGLGCSSRSARYLSPIGAIFEVRRAVSIDPESYSASDAIVCNELAERQVLTGPLGATFPHAPAEPGTEPRDCLGPAGSMTDVAGTTPSDTSSHDGVWSTWDGCLVRPDVIFSQSTLPTCAGNDVRLLTFAADLGRPITDGSAVVRYLRDPNGVVAASTDPFRSYDVPSSDVHDTGLRFGDQQLWVSDETDRAVYVRVGRGIERWPRFDGDVSCGPVVTTD